jgi:hypothetical protein
MRLDEFFARLLRLRMSLGEFFLDHLLDESFLSLVRESSVDYCVRSRPLRCERVGKAFLKKRILDWGAPRLGGVDRVREVHDYNWSETFLSEGSGRKKMSFQKHTSYFGKKKKRKRDVVNEVKEVEDAGVESPPKVFRGVDSWPKKTNCDCLNCGMKIEGMPWFDPIQIEPTPVNSTMLEDGLEEQGYSVMRGGIFCSPNCVARWIADLNCPEYVKDDRRQMLNFLYRFVTGVEIKFVKLSPKREELIRFGGTLKDEEYRAIVANL